MTAITVHCTSDECSEEREINEGDVPDRKLPKCLVCESAMLPQRLMSMKEHILPISEVED